MTPRKSAPPEYITGKQYADNPKKGRKRGATAHAGPPPAATLQPSPTAGPVRAPQAAIDAQVMATWRTLNANLTGLDEDTARRMLEAEVAGRGRVQLILRLYGHMNKLRAIRERTELVKRFLK